MRTDDKPTFGHALQVLTLIGHKDPTGSKVTELCNGGFLSDLLDVDDLSTVDRERFRAALQPELPTRLSGVFRLTVNYEDYTFDEMARMGRYDWGHSDINGSRFPIEGTGIQEFEARYFLNRKREHGFGFAAFDPMRKMIAEADKENPWSPAKIEHLFAHGAAHPLEQCWFRIMGIGSVADLPVPRGSDPRKMTPFLRGLWNGGRPRDRAIDVDSFCDRSQSIGEDNRRYLAVRPVRPH